MSDFPEPKVPSTAWRWPPKWPFPDDFMTKTDSNFVSNVKISSAVKEKVRSHLGYYFDTKDSVLEIGTAEDSVLPNATFQNIQNVRLLSIAPEAFSSLPFLSQPYNSESNFSFPYEDKTFNKVVWSSGIESIVNPREVFREIWRVLQPGGSCFICFTSQPILSSTLRPIKMWTTMNEEQKIWIIGSYFQYSAGDGFRTIEGFDLFNKTGTREMIFQDTNTEESAFVVQAVKSFLPSIENGDSYGFIYSSMLGFPYMEQDDKKYTALRLSAEYNRSVPGNERDNILASLPALKQIYFHLKEVKEVVLPTPIKAMLASLLAPRWSNTNAQIDALRRSVGVDPPDDLFWKPLGKITSLLKPRDKVYLISNLIPLFGKKDEDLAVIPSLLEELNEAIAEKLDLSDVPDRSDIQLLASEFVIREYLSISASKGRIFSFLQQVSSSNLRELINVRKSVWTVNV